MSPAPVIRIRQVRLWDSVMAWHWVCLECPKVNGRHRGGYHRIRAAHWRPSGDPFRNCHQGAARHLYDHHTNKENRP